MIEGAPRWTSSVTVIDASRGATWPNLGELWRYRDTLYFLARRDIAIRYKQTAIGVLWVVLQPIAFALVYASFLSLIGSIPSQGVPYGVFALTSMTLWLFFVAALSRVSGSTVSSSALISKIWFPRLIVPLAAMGPALVDLVVSGVVLMFVLLLFGVVPEAKILLAPFAAALGGLCAFGLGIWFSAIAVRYRDVEQLVPFLTQILLFVTPILYPSDVVPQALQTLYAFNPLVGMVEAFRWTVLPDAPFPGTHLAITLAFVAIVLPTGLMYYQRHQQLFVDEI
jgi:lipopolysaccharide transport system permease protein